MTRILEARVNAGLSQKEVALSLGVKAPSVWAWESGKSKPTAANLEALSKLYHVSVDYLLGRDDEPTTKKEPATPGRPDDQFSSRIALLSPENLARMDAYLDGLLAAQDAQAP